MTSKGVAIDNSPGAGAEPSAFRGIEIALVIPTLNEEAGLPLTLDNIPFDLMLEHGWNVRPLIVDGGSTDRTLEICRARGLSVLVQRSRGKGAAIREALDWLGEQGVKYAVIMDGDGTYPGSKVPSILSLLNNGSQVVVGVRQPNFKPTSVARDLVHRIGNGLLNYAANQIAQMPILDVCSGFWGVEIAPVVALQLETDGFEIEAELFIKAFRAGYRITQLPVVYSERVGVAKLHAARDGVRILLTVIRYGRRGLRAAPSAVLPTLQSDLLSILMAHPAEDVLFVADPSRRSEVDLLIRDFRAGRPLARVLVRSAEGTLAVEPLEPEKSRTDPVIVVLPARGPNTESTARIPGALVTLPRYDRLIELQEFSSSEPYSGTGLDALGRTLLSISAGYRSELVSGRRSHMEPVRLLVTNVLASPSAKELAILGANGRRSNLTVWKGAGLDLPAGLPEPTDPAGVGRPTEARTLEQGQTAY